MKILFFSLVLANLGVLAWANWFRAESQTPDFYDGPGMTLLREVDPSSLPDMTGLEDSVELAPAQAGSDGSNSSERLAAEAVSIVAAESAEPEAGSPGIGAGGTAAGRCIAIGPFDDAESLLAAESMLSGSGFAPEQVAYEEEVWDGYWLYIGQLGTQAAAREVLATLSENGIDDAYIIPDTDSGVVISLGVFSQISRAGSVADRVSDLGFEGTIADRMSLRESLWLEIELEGEVAAILEVVQGRDGLSQVEQRSCSTLSPD